MSVVYFVVYHYLRKGGVTPCRVRRHRGGLEERAPDIIAAYCGGLTIIETAEKFAASRRGVSDLIERHGAKLPAEEVERRRIEKVRAANHRRFRALEAA